MSGLQPINFGGVGKVEMYPAETNDAMISLQAAGRPIKETWQQVSGAIAADEAKVGTGFDDLSTAFRGQYNVLSESLKKIAAAAGDSFEKMGANGVAIVVHYLELDNQAAALLKSSPSNSSRV